MPEKQVIYFDENARDKEAEIRRYSESKLNNAAIEEQKRLDASWEKYEKRLARRKKWAASIRNFFTKKKAKAQPQKQNQR